MSELVRISNYSDEKFCQTKSIPTHSTTSSLCFITLIKYLALGSKEVLTIENKFPRKFHNLNVWIGDPVWAPAQAIIRNICVRTASEPPDDSNVTIARVINEFVY